jgi:hypothetical protein
MISQMTAPATMPASMIEQLYHDTYTCGRFGCRVMLNYAARPPITATS